MMSFCKSLLGLEQSDRRRFTPPASDGLRLIAADCLKYSPGLLSSSALKFRTRLPEERDELDPRLWIGSYDVNGLRSCTESLGFESSDERGSEEGDREMLQIRLPMRKKPGKHWPAKRADFPPPLPSLNVKGERSFFLRSEKKDGRLRLTEVKNIRRQVVLRASRRDGRLRLDLIRNTAGEDETVDGIGRSKAEGEEAVRENAQDIREDASEPPSSPARSRCQYARYLRSHHDRLSQWDQRCVTGS